VLLLFEADDVLAGRVNGVVVVEVDLALDVDGGARDGRGRRLLLVDATIPSKGLLLCEAFTYVKRDSLSIELGRIEKVAYFARRRNSPSHITRITILDVRAKSRGEGSFR